MAAKPSIGQRFAAWFRGPPARIDGPSPSAPRNTSSDRENSDSGSRPAIPSSDAEQTGSNSSGGSDAPTSPAIAEGWPSAPTLVVALVGLGLFCLVGFLVVLAFNPKSNTLSYELGKTFLQLLAIAVIGGILSLLTFEYQRNRDERRALQQRRDEALSDLLHDALRNYRAVKRARRQLRAHCVLTDSGEEITFSDYDAQLAVIIDAQLEFENLRDLVWQIDDGRVSRTRLSQSFEEIESFLNKNLIDEYQASRPRLSAASRRSSIPLQDLKNLKRFIAAAKSDPFFQHGAVQPMKDIVRDLQFALTSQFPKGPKRGQVSSSSSSR